MKNLTTLSVSTGKGIGTYQWMAPELIENTRYSNKIDVYSFGIILWELLSGQVPYANLGFSENYQLIIHVKEGKRLTINTSWDDSLVLLIKQCWDANPNARPTISDVLNNLTNGKSLPITLTSISTKSHKSSVRFDKERMERELKEREHEREREWIEKERMRERERIERERIERERIERERIERERIERERESFMRILQESRENEERERIKREQAERELQKLKKNNVSSLHHHTLTYGQNYYYTYICNICGGTDSGCRWVCAPCKFDVCTRCSNDTTEFVDTPGEVEAIKKIQSILRSTGSGYKRNRAGRPINNSGYCGVYFGRVNFYHDGICGPNNGPKCPDCY